ncbi:MAG: SHOCT domain-containing protein [Candidatus Binatia bacterium]|jgi:uncharacterized membrane protein
MRLNRVITAVQVMLMAALFSACFSFRGGDETVIQQRPSTQRELQDLKAAYDKGIISEQEYNQQRDRLLGR